MNVLVYDNGISNLKSMVSAIKYTGNKPIITKDCNIQKNKYSHLILPGVGSFGSAMQIMKKNSADQRIKDFLANGGQILGVCLGMQLLFDKGFEGGQVSGLGILEGSVQHLPPPNKKNGETIPNMGWHDIRINSESPLIEKKTHSIQCYFVHEFHCVPVNSEITTMEISYGNKNICAGVNKGGINGVQFHPEKSGEMGLDMISRFINS